MHSGFLPFILELPMRMIGRAFLDPLLLGVSHNSLL